MIIGIIIAVIIGVFILYMFWSKGMLPFTKATTQAQCKSYFVSECQKSASAGWDPSVFKMVKGCRDFVSNKDAFDCCVNGVGCTSPGGLGCTSSKEVCEEKACEAMCTEFIG